MTANASVLQRTEQFVRDYFGKDSSGHDWWHIHRVRQNALHLAEKEGADPFTVEMAALLHDIGDYKLRSATDADARTQIASFLSSIDVESETSESIIAIVEGVSYKGAKVATNPTSLEGKVVQDADRLDAIGAIGVARTFAYGGHKGNPMHDPTETHQEHASFEEYQKGGNTTINHFYEKLLLLKDRMQTTTGKALAEERHAYMQQFLQQFYAEWEGQK